MVTYLIPIIGRVFELRMAADANLDQIVVYACLKLLQLFQRLVNYNIDGPLLDLLSELKEKEPGLKATINRLTGQLERADSTEANSQK